MVYHFKCNCFWRKQHYYINNLKRLELWCLTPLSIIFQLYHVVSFIGGGNRITRRKPSTCSKSLTGFIT